MQVFHRQLSVHCATVFGLDTLLVAAAVGFATSIEGPVMSGPAGLAQTATVTMMFALCCYYNDLYDLTAVHSTSEVVIRFLQVAGATAMILAVVSPIVPQLHVASATFLMLIGLLLVGIPLVRKTCERLARDPYVAERVLILGAGARARAIAREIRRQHQFAYRVVGFVDDSSGLTEPRETANGAAAAPDAPRVLGSRDDLARLVAAWRVDRIVVGVSDRRGSLPIDQLLEARLSGVCVEDVATTYERIAGKVLVEGIWPSWLIFSDGFRAARRARVAKRGFDVVTAIIALVVGAPLMAVTALAIRLDSRGPIFYRQERVGQGGRVFTLWKFRSMRVDAERGTPVWASDRDDRVTRVGRAIRFTRVDELPQLWNVLGGDMSLVGPRPERPFFVEQLAAQIPFYNTRHVVRPGITGWAQVKYRYGSSAEDATEKLRYDLYYIKHLSIGFDLTILIDTVKVVLFGKGAK
jgi:sugar transferase (PEP-CTERM system associated)